MTSSQLGPIGEDDLQAFIDNRLTDARRQQVEAYLTENPEVADRVALDQRYRDSLRTMLAGKFAEPIPARLRVANISSARRAAVRRRFSMIAAAVAIFIIGAASGWVAGRILPPTSTAAIVADNAATAYWTFVGEVVHPVEVAAAQEEHLLRWLSRRLGRPLVAPDLSKFGYRLMGGRLLPASQGAAAQLMYEAAAGERLTIYVQAKQDGETAFRFQQSAEASTFVWVDRGFGFAVTARITRERLLPIAEAIYLKLGESDDAQRHRKGQS